MTEDSTKLTMRDVAERKAAARLSFREGRYVTRGGPRTGGIAQVYKATDADTGQTVAIKILQRSEATDGVIQESFRREVQALSDLKHPNIVRILDSGLDDDSGAHFIVMEWIEQDLSALCRARPFTRWDDFYEKVGRGVLEALIFAHTSSTVHRDIKPSNILITEDGRPKLCDFGISKIRNFLAPGVTLAQFASAPYAPPEQDEGSYSFSRDVFGFAALAVAALSAEPPKTHSQVIDALGKVDLPEPLRQLFKLCLSLADPIERPANAVMLAAKMREALPATVASASDAILISLTAKVNNLLHADMGLRGAAAISFVESDLDGCSCEQIKPTADRPNRALRLLGNRYGYTAAVDETEEKLTLVSAAEFSPSEMEKKRLYACDLNCRLTVSGIRPAESASSLSALFDRLAEFETDQKLRRFDQKQQAIFSTWLNLLTAKTDLEKKRRVRVRYDGVEHSAEFVRLKVAQGEDAAVLSEQDVTVEVMDRLVYRASVISTQDGVVVLKPTVRNEANPESLPEDGCIEVDTAKSDVALDKQKTALDAVKFCRSVNPDLGRQLADPASIDVPPPAMVDFIQDQIDEDKKEAVRAALGGPSLMIVQGPPGTGKTTLITELVLQTLKANPNARVLLTSQTHVALDNSLERIVAKAGPSLRALRIGNDTDEKISAGTRPLLLDNRIPAMRKEAMASGRRFIEQWAISNGLSLAEIRKAMVLERHALLKTRIEFLDDELKAIAPNLGLEHGADQSEDEKAELEDRFQGLRKERDDLAREIRESQKEMAEYVENKEELKEFSECSATDLHAWADLYTNKTPAGLQVKKMLLADAECVTRFGRNREFIAALVASAQVVAGTCLGVMSVPGHKEIVFDLCIVDEASIATPTEVLVPMARARRTVLVGDRRQLSPFQDPELKERGLLEKYSLTEANQKDTLFNLLSDHLPADLHKELTTQHRMVPALGELTSQCFYNGKLKSITRDPLPYLATLFPKPVTWYTSSGLERRQSRRVGNSWFNDLEVEQCVVLLNRVNFLLCNSKPRGKKVSVALLTGYSEQKRRLKIAIETRSHEWEGFSEIFINVVDAFQGREADLVIFSVTRSEVKGLGFLKEMERINVALSRARELLVIVGDHVYCQGITGAVNPLRDVLDHIQTNPSTCVIAELTK